MELRLIFVFYVCCVKLSVAAPPPQDVKAKTVLRDKPTGHCDPACACQVDGQYYAVGERWATPQDPCKIFECFANGFVDIVSQGCSYKGECKAVESTWIDECNTYACVEEVVLQYRLVEPGCKTESGKCMKVGKRTQAGCDILECQIEGGSLSINKILTGCAVEGGCKPVGSYWHDGCTVYNCTVEAGQTVEKSLGNEVMHWPDSNFALLKPQTGCPKDSPTQWAEGYRKHYGEGQNFFSIPLSLAGDYNLEYMTHEFCVHQSQSGNGKTPQLTKYTTLWEPGSYCILRSGGTCPRGFNAGFILFVHNKKKTQLAEASGTLPDGDYSTDTGLFFCCRGDGPAGKEIVLPKDQAFVMFLSQGATECQKVRGTTNSVEFFSFDGSPASTIVQNGSIPEVKFDVGDIILYLCLYEPVGCGCVDIDGQFVAMGTERTLDCITKKCVSERGFSTLQTVTAGCLVDGQCTPENSEWSMKHGESCTKQSCKKVLLPDNVGTYKIVNIAEGCLDGDICRDLNFERYQDCYTSVCSMNPKTNHAEFKIRKADCPWQGSCKPVNSTWTHNCMTYRCDMDVQGGNYQWRIQPIEYGCNDGSACYKVGDIIQGRCYQAECKLNANKTFVFLDVTRGGCTWKNECKKVNESWVDGCHSYQCIWTESDTGFAAVVNATKVSCEWNNTCYQDNEVWTDGCVDYKCVVNRQEAEVKWGVETVRLGCRDFQGNCLAVGDNVTEGCITYQCNFQGDRIGLDAIATGCEWNNSCQPENAVWTDDKKCVDYKCIKIPHKDGSVMQIKIINYACVFNNTCMPVNATWLDGCRNRKCVVRKTGNMIQRDTAPISAGCDDEGVCRPVGYKKITPTCMTYECRFNEELKDSFFTLSGGVCRSRNGTCYEIGQTWDEKEPGICVKYKCVQNMDGHKSEIVEQSCRDVNGICKPIGSTGFSAEVQGQLRGDCTCTQAQNRIIGVSVSCAK